MNTTQDGGHAFPTIYLDPEYGSGYSGMTLRDYFAGQALAGWIAGTRDPEASSWDHRWWAREAYATADAMLAERQKGAP